MAVASEAISVRSTVNVIQYLVQEAGRATGRWSTWGQQDPQGHYNMCCSQLRRMDSECTCMGIERAVQTMLQQHQRGVGFQTRGLDVQSAQQLAESLPGKCLTSPSRCRITIRSTSF
ncbi:hypothetical protein LINGRAHAP2_LOCUS25676 [Linum grandiflorum]